MNNQEMISAYHNYLRRERNVSQNTLVSYEFDLRKFSGWLAKDLRHVERLDIQRYLADLLSSGRTAATAARRLACLRNFYGFLIDEELIEMNPTRNLPMPKGWKKVPNTLNAAEMEKIVASLGSSRLDLCDKAILLTFFASGLRVSELVGLTLQDIDLEARAVKVWDGKGGKDGVVPLSPPSVAALKVYLESVRPKLPHAATSPFLFLGRNGKKLTRQEIRNRIRKTTSAALGRRLSPHSLRHGFATALIEGGADVRDVQALMRHSSVDTTARYIHLDLNYLRRIFNANHPRARFAKA